MLKDIVDNIMWLGHDGFMIKVAGKIIVIDPFKVSKVEPADILLVTHAHHDHCSPEDIDKLKTDSTVIVTEPESADELRGNIKTLKPWDSLTIGEITIEAVPAYNTNKKFHPKEKNWLGFIIEVEGVRIYHAGDTDLIDEMADFTVDIALLPVSGTYVMTAAEAVDAVKRIKPRVAIPMHYNAIVGTEDDARAFLEGVQGICNVTLPKPA